MCSANTIDLNLDSTSWHKLLLSGWWLIDSFARSYLKLNLQPCQLNEPSGTYISA